MLQYVKIGGVIFLLVLLISSSATLRASPQSDSIVLTDIIKLNARHYTMADGLPSNTIRCIHQDKQGFIWIGTSNGLCRYDGYNFNIFLPLPPDSDEPGLASNSVIAISEDSNEHLWIQCSPRRLCCFDLRQGRFVDFTGIGAYSDFFEVPTLLDNGDVWVWNEDYVYGISYTPSGELQTVPYKRSEKRLSKGTIRFINKEQDGWTWIGATSGLACISPGAEPCELRPGQLLCGHAFCSFFFAACWPGARYGRMKCLCSLPTMPVLSRGIS